MIASPEFQCPADVTHAARQARLMRSLANELERIYAMSKALEDAGMRAEVQGSLLDPIAELRAEAERLGRTVTDFEWVA